MNAKTVAQGAKSNSIGIGAILVAFFSVIQGYLSHQEERLRSDRLAEKTAIEVVQTEHRFDRIDRSTEKLRDTLQATLQTNARLEERAGAFERRIAELERRLRMRRRPEPARTPAKAEVTIELEPPAEAPPVGAGHPRVKAWLQQVTEPEE